MIPTASQEVERDFRERGLTGREAEAARSALAGMTAAAFFGVREALLLVTAIALCGPVQALLPRFKTWLREKTEPRPLGTAVLLALLFCSIVLVTANNYQGFIYAQF